MNAAKDLRARLSQTKILVAPGVYDALSATIAEQTGFEALFASGSALAATQLARPDIGLLSLTETAEIVSRIADRVSIPLLVDVDQGGGNCYAVARYVRMLEKAGAAGVQIEDQLEVKPADEPLSRPLVSTQEMVEKIKAAKDACHGDTVVSARSDAATSEGLEAAIDRTNAYIDAGADMIFVESLSRREHMERLVAAVGGRVPVLHNLLRPTDEVNDAMALEQIGYSVALFPAAVMRAVGEAIRISLEDLLSAPLLKEEDCNPDFIGARQFLGQ